MVGLFIFAAGVVTGVVHHAWLHPILKRWWKALKDKFPMSV